MANRQRDPAKEQFWRRVVRRFESRGLTIREFCRREGLREQNFYAWRRELRRRDRLGQPAGTAGQTKHHQSRRQRRRPFFVPLRLAADDGRPTLSDAVAIVLSGGRTIRVGAHFDPRTLAAVLQVLEAQPC